MPKLKLDPIYWLSVGGVLIERIEPSAVFCLLPRRAKDFSRSFEEVGRTGFWGRVSGRGGPYTAVALRQNSRENQHLVSGIGLERKQSGLYQKRKQLKTSEKPRVLPRAVWNCKKKQAFNSVRHTQFLMVCYDLS